MMQAAGKYCASSGGLRAVEVISRRKKVRGLANKRKKRFRESRAKGTLNFSDDLTSSRKQQNGIDEIYFRTTRANGLLGARLFARYGRRIQ
jgi:hypothetical protein